jgi:F0F1-type ATP synthase assembly protein I
LSLAFWDDEFTSEEPIMKASLILGGIVGGLVAFMWSSLSWIVLPMHQAAFLKFKDEPAVTAAIAQNAPASGVYLLPNAHANAAELTSAQLRAQEAEASKQWRTGPSAVVAVRTGGIASMGSSIATHLVTMIVAGLLLAWLVSRTSGLSYWGKVGFALVVAITGGVLTNVPEWNWWGYSTAYTAAAFVDLVVGWFLGGLIIAKFG